MLKKQITVVDVRTLTPPPDKSTLQLDPPQYVSTGNSITLWPTPQDFLSDSWEKGRSWEKGSCLSIPAGLSIPWLAGSTPRLPLSSGHGAAGGTRGPVEADGWLDLADS